MRLREFDKNSLSLKCSSAGRKAENDELGRRIGWVG